MRLRAPAVAIAGAVILAAVACGAGAGPARSATAGPASPPLAARTTAPAVASVGSAATVEVAFQTFELLEGSGPHDVAPAADGGVWYTAQLRGTLGWLDPASGTVREITLGPGSAPHGVIVGPDGAPWVTDGGQDAILRVDPKTDAITRYPLPSRSGRADLNTATFDRSGRLWFTGQAGVYGRVDPRSAEVLIFDAPSGPGAYGMTTTPQGDVFFVSLAGSYLAKVDVATGAATVLHPPTAGAGTRRVWSDSQGVLWVSEWNAGQLARFDPASGRWREWKLPGERPMAYAVFVDDHDRVWLTDWGANALVRFDPVRETFTTHPFVVADANVRQLLGRSGEVWGALSGADKLFVARVR